jgi:predicted  nucleic acid-binding Zn-ribbon protein
MRVRPLVAANLRTFLRNWKSVVLLVGLPLLIIGLIFASFSSDLRSLPIGGVNEADEFELEDFQERTSSFADMKEYESTESCLQDIRRYKIYACAVISGSEGNYQIKLYYDNTRSIVGGKITESVKNVASSMQIAYSQERASDVIAEVERVNSDIEELLGQVRQARSDIQVKIQDLRAKVNNLMVARDDLRNDLRDMDEDVQDAEKDVEEMSETRQEFYQTSSSRIDSIQLLLQGLDDLSGNNSRRINEAQENLSEIENRLDERNEEVKSEIDTYEDLIQNYWEFRADSRDYLEQMNRTIADLNATIEDLERYEKRLGKLESDLEEMNHRYSQVAEMDPSKMGSAVQVNNRRSYIPGQEGAQEAGIDAETASLLTVQTVYSALLLLVTFFVSLLVAMFITLKTINSSSKERLDAIKGTFLAEYISTYLSSLIIISLPVTCVLLLGNFLFELPIFANIDTIALTVFLLSSSMINLGMLLSYQIRKKSITLMVGSLLFVFLIFFSGLLLPVEMMNGWAAIMAGSLPGSLAKKAFDISVMYGQPMKVITTEIVGLYLWNLLLVALALIVKERKENYSYIENLIEG